MFPVEHEGVDRVGAVLLLVAGGSKVERAIKNIFVLILFFGWRDWPITGGHQLPIPRKPL